jgi:hemerythrin-like metal-binding protein
VEDSRTKEVVNMAMATKVPEILPWKQAYSVGVANFDGHHRELVRLINEFHEAMAMARSREILDYVLDRLIKYAGYHFRAEESVMQAHAYPGLEVHKFEHRKFLHKVKSFHKDFLAGRSMPTIDVMVFLKDWLINHIQGTDQRYSPFLKGRGIV